MSVFSNPIPDSAPFFTCLRVDGVRTKESDDIRDLLTCWRNIAHGITNLKLSDLSLLFGGVPWTDLEELEIDDDIFELPEYIIIPSLKVLRIEDQNSYAVRTDSKLSEQLQQAFPNLIEFHTYSLRPEPDNWILQRWKGMQYTYSTEEDNMASNLQALEDLTLRHFDQRNAKRAEKFIKSLPNLKEISLETGCFPTPAWEQIIELNVVLTGKYVAAEYLINVNRLKKLTIREVYQRSDACFFSHKVVKMPLLEKLETCVESRCEACWMTLFESCSSISSADFEYSLIIFQHLNLLENLNELSFYGFGNQRHSLGISKANFKVCHAKILNLFEVSTEYFEETLQLLKFFPNVELFGLFCSITQEYCTRSFKETFSGLINMAPRLRVSYLFVGGYV